MPKGEITRALGEWAKEKGDLDGRYRAERMELLERQAELFIRAREHGLTNKEIAEALNAGINDGDLDEDRLAYVTYAPQSVTAMMRDADAQVEWAAWRLMRDATTDDDDA
jgi:hypothetical protein